MDIKNNLYDYGVLTEINFEENELTIKFSKEFFEKYILNPCGLIKVSKVVSLLEDIK